MKYEPRAPLPPDPTKQTRTERLSRLYMMDAMAQTEYDILHGLYTTGRLPDEWHEIAYETGRRKALSKVTIRLETDVVKFFKALGPGYQEKINRVLASFVHARLARMIGGPDTSDFVLRPEEVMALAQKRRGWGEAEDMMEGRGRS